MRLKFFSIFLYVFSLGNLHAQTVVSGLVTDSLNVPIPFASVYLSKTTIGNMTDKEGAYTLTIPQNGEYELVASCIGYKSRKSILIADGKPIKINIKLSLELVRIDEVTVQTKDRNRIKNYTEFTKLFLGASVNAQNCRILNTEDLYLRKEGESEIVKGRSLKPLQIENRSLGYKITYDLTDFTYDPKSGFLRYSGNPYFQHLPGNAKESKKYQLRRLRTYYGSRMHFLRSLFVDSLTRENFRVSNFEVETTKDKRGIEIQDIKPLPENSLQISRESGFMTLYSLKPLLVSYVDNKPELATELIGFEPREYQSTLQLTKRLKVFQNGRVTDPYSATWQGAMASERIADILPDDFQPHAQLESQPEAETTENPAEKQLAFLQRSVGSDQVFVHLDRNSYRPGDTIFFQAYVRNRFTGNFESSRASLYALLFNEKRTITDSARYRLDNATASGWMALPAKAETGRYRFVAFTGTMQNYNAADAFQLDIAIREPDRSPEKIAVTFDKAKYQPGDLVEATIGITDPAGKPLGLHKFKSSFVSGKKELKSEETATNTKGEAIVRMTLPDSTTTQPRLKISIAQNSGKELLAKSVAVPYESSRLTLKFLPEGGTFVKGLNQRIGFNATDSKGEPVQVKGLLINGYGDTIDTIQSGEWGPGYFLCNAQPGLRVELLEGAGNQKIWPLPVPASGGMTLKVEEDDDRSFAVEVESDRYNGETVTVMGTMNLATVFSQELVLNKKQRFVVQTGELPSGIAEITLYDSAFRPVADRLFAVNSDKRLRFNIETDANSLPGKESELTISVTDGQGNPAEGFFSLAVTDSVKGIDAALFIPGIEYSFNYHPSFMGNLPAKVLASGFENLLEEDRNLLLMVYGWAKFNRDLRQDKLEEIRPIDYDVLNIKLLNTAKNQRGGRSLNLVSLEGPSVMTLVTGESGDIVWPLDSLPPVTRMVTLMPDTRDKNKSLEARMDIPYKPEYFKSDQLFLPQPELPADEYSVSLPFQYYSLGEKTIDIREVTVVGRATPKVYKDKYEEKYQFTNIKSLEPEMLESSTNLETAIRKLVTPYKWTSTNIYLRSTRSFLGGSVPALIVLDGMPLYNDPWPMVSRIPVSEITSLTILSGQRGYSTYGNGAQGGVIFINTRSTGTNNLPGNPSKWYSNANGSNLVKPMQLFRPSIEFYLPLKPETDFDPLLQSRATLYWDPEVYFGGKEPVKIKVNNLKHTGAVVVTINGVSVDNLVGTGRGRYEIK